MNTARLCAGRADPTGSVPQVVRDAMITDPKTCGSATTVAQAHEMLRDDHVHALLLVEGNRLVAVVQRDDLDNREGSRPAAECGGITDRVVAPDGELAVVFRTMVARSVRRLAVVDHDLRLLGLLCLKRTSRGFCSDEDVLARAGAAGEFAACR